LQPPPHPSTASASRAQLVQTSTYNTTTRARIAGLILQTLGRLDVPLAVGAYTGEQAQPQAGIADGYALDDFVAAGGQLSYGTGALRGLMAAATPSAPLYVIEIAPATSLGGLLMEEPALARGCVCVAMSGSIYHGAWVGGRRGIMVHSSSCRAEGLWVDTRAAASTARHLGCCPSSSSAAAGHGRRRLLKRQRVRQCIRQRGRHR
jgi:hypothetical protein